MTPPSFAANTVSRNKNSRGSANGSVLRVSEERAITVSL
jgi:hypothetical protein